MNENQTFSGKAMRAAEQELQGAMPSEQEERTADLVYTTMSSINRAEEEIGRELDRLQLASASALKDLDTGYRLQPFDVSRLNENITKRQSGFDLLSALIGQDGIKKFQEM